MASLYRLVFGVSRCAAIVAAAALVFMVCLIAWEILLRWFFSTSTFVTAELVGYAMMLCITWSLGYVLEHEQLIRVRILLGHLPQRACDWLTAASALMVAGAVFGLISIYWTRAARAYQRGTVSSSIAAVPTWIIEAIMLLGLGVFALQLLAYASRHLSGHPAPAGVTPASLPE